MFDFKPNYVLIFGRKENKPNSSLTVQIMCPDLLLPDYQASKYGVLLGDVSNNFPISPNYAKILDNTIYWYYNMGRSAFLASNSKDVVYTYSCIGVVE